MLKCSDIISSILFKSIITAEINRAKVMTINEFKD